MVSSIKPRYLILKPSLLGGFESCKEWIDIANKHNVKWWVTSALESNIGLNAIAQWTYILLNTESPFEGGQGGALPQGLGTGRLYTNNIPSPLVIEKSRLWYTGNDWDINKIIN